MHRFGFWSGSLLLTTFFLAGLEAQGPRSRLEYPTPLVRERQRVLVGNTRETWELRWKAAPKPVCEPKRDSLTCPCTGFAYGEAGDLALVRIRNGREIERLDLTSLFQDTEGPAADGLAILPRWEANYDTDFDAANKAGFPDVVARRPVVEVMNFMDYDHDGNASEFFFHTSTLPCGKRYGAVIGVSKSNPSLHVFGSADAPNKPLVLQRFVWEALSRSSGAIEQTDWACGDHGGDQETTIRLQNTSKGITGARRTFSCPRTPGQLPIKEDPL